MRLTIDSSRVKGEPGTGYEPPAGKGPFECGNCEYFRAADSSCGQATMMKVSKLVRIDGSYGGGGRVKVDEHGCCEYVDRKASEKRAAFQQAHKSGAWTNSTSRTNPGSTIR